MEPEEKRILLVEAQNTELRESLIRHLRTIVKDTPLIVESLQDREQRLRDRAQELKDLLYSVSFSAPAPKKENHSNKRPNQYKRSK